jgi:(p)ppGpp synthase/HD superfamily hydrolase
MHGYSDQINHAFAFAAKHYWATAPRGAGMDYLAHPSNVAIILTRYGVEHTTLVSGILHHVLEEAQPRDVPELEKKISSKFGPVVLAIAKDALEPRFDARGEALSWQSARDAMLAHAAGAEPRSLDIIVADEIHGCGTTITALRRLGVEYLRTYSRSTSSQTIWWYRSLLEVVAARNDWPHHAMLDELRMLSMDLVRDLRQSEDAA